MDIGTRWLLVIGIGTLCFGISLFVLRIPIRTIIVFFSIGLPLVALWLYVDVKSKQQKTVDVIVREACICSICKHKEAKLCLQQKCACCIIMKGGTVIGHSVNPLQ
jgi:hypothetical protein